MKKTPSINSGSMADIAFLLLIFFLVATTIEQDKGLLRKLPPDLPTVNSPFHKRNVLMVLVNAKNAIQVNGDPVEVDSLKEICKAFIDNRGKRKDWSEKPQKAIISLKASVNTDYDTYIQVQNELARAYRELRDAFALSHYGRKFFELDNPEQIKAVKKRYPMRISETEPDKSQMAENRPT